MFIPSVQDAPASTESSSNETTAFDTQRTQPCPSTTLRAEPIRHMLFGSLTAVQSTIRILHKHGYADPNDWSQPISTGRPNEVMAILTKRVRMETQQ